MKIFKDNREITKEYLEHYFFIEDYEKEKMLDYYQAENEEFLKNWQGIKERIFFLPE